MQSELDRAAAISQTLRALADGEDGKALEIAGNLLQRWPDDAGVRQLMAAVALRQSKPVGG